MEAGQRWLMLQVKTRRGFTVSHVESRHILNSIPTVIYVLAVTAKGFPSQWVSDSVKRILGYEVEEALADDWWVDCLHPDDKEIAIEKTSILMARGHLVQEYRLRSKDGHYLWMQDEASLLRDADGQPKEIVGFWTNITERKQAEEELKSRTQQLLALSHLGQQVLSGTAIPALITEAVCHISKTLKLSHVGFFERCPDTKALLLRAEIGVAELFAQTIVDLRTLGALALAGGEPIVVNDLRQDLRFPGDPSWQAQFPVSGVSVAVGGPEQPAGILCAFADTKCAFSENDIQFLRSTANVLAMAIARQRTEARTHRLQNELLRVSKTSIIGELGTAVAHELNQPITSVMNYVNACRRLLATSNGCVSREILDLMGEAVVEAERAGTILRHLRGLVEKGELQRTAQALNEIIHDAARLAVAEAEQENIHVSLELEDDLPHVFIDKIQVQLVLFNLVRNAMEALERSPKREIGIKTLRSKDGAVEVQVRDTGPGVDPRLVDQLFTEYFSTKEHGMGVGLSISQSIVDAHGGRLWVTNTSGGGATFHFTLPIVEPEHGE
jgi:two-component system, LuxR family, sensor kinase FixL